MPTFIGAEFISEAVHIAELMTKVGTGQLLLNRFFMPHDPQRTNVRYRDPTLQDDAFLTARQLLMFVAPYFTEDVQAAWAGLVDQLADT
jgi:hypothetical protein